MRPLTLGLVFHFNQNIVPMAYIANQVCYRRLLETFLAHPNCQFTIHFSGTLLSALSWDDQGTLGLLKQGIEENRFELLGSGYAQNILLATADWDNVQQLAHHRKQLQDLFGVAPTGFWNAERCWDQKLAKLILDAGYEYTFLETNVFRRAGDTEHQSLIRATTHGDRSLVLFNDDTNILSLFGKAIRTGSSGELIEYLYNLWLTQNQLGQDFTVIYAQDAEATGLWQFEGGGQSQDDIYHKLHCLLGELEKLPWLQVGGLQEKAREAKPLVYPHLPPGQANWMLDSLRSENLPWGDPGYASWFEYANTAPKNIQTRELYAQISRKLQKQEKTLLAFDQSLLQYETSKALYDLAVRTLIAHQYEFGCIGIDVYKEAQWQLARTALVALWASELALGEKATRVETFDVNNDGLEEICVVAHDHAYVFAPKGGRLLYWFDLSRGTQLVGNQVTRYYLESYRDDHSYTSAVTVGRELVPQFNGKPELGPLQDRRFPIRARCLNDSISFDGSRPISLTDFPFQVTSVLSERGPKLEFVYEGELFKYTKEISFNEQGPEIHYTWSKYPGEEQVTFFLENELHPDYLRILNLGSAHLETKLENSTVTLRNGAGCELEATVLVEQPARCLVAKEAGFLAWLVSAKVIVDLREAPGQTLEYTVKLASR